MNELGLEILDVSLRVQTSRREGHTLFEGLSLHIEPSTTATLLGASGSGKSSLLSWMCGVQAPAVRAEGGLYFNGRNLTQLPPEQRRLGILFQDDLLFPHLTVGDNLAFALPPDQRRWVVRRRVIEGALADAGLEGMAVRHPATLSGGQRARVALMRVLLSQPDALLLDEPFSKLDPDTRVQFRQFVFDHARARELPVLLVSHDMEDAKAAQGQLISIDGKFFSKRA